MSNNLFQYKTPKSGNEETGFYNIKGRITLKAFLYRANLCLIIFFISWLLLKSGVYQSLGMRFEIFLETVHFYILPVLLLLFFTIQSIKRLHDTNKSGKLIIVPFYNIYLLFSPGTIGNNDFGIDPKPSRNILYFDELEKNQESPASTKLNNEQTFTTKTKFIGALILPIIILALLISLSDYKFGFTQPTSEITNSIDTITNSASQNSGIDDKPLIKKNIKFKSVEFQNKSSHDVYFCIGFKHKNKWISEGWYYAGSNDYYKYELPNNFKSNEIYWYASSVKNAKEWIGNDKYFPIEEFGNKSRLFISENGTFTKAFGDGFKVDKGFRKELLETENTIFHFFDNSASDKPVDVEELIEEPVDPNSL